MRRATSLLARLARQGRGLALAGEEAAAVGTAAARSAAVPALHRLCTAGSAQPSSHLPAAAAHYTTAAGSGPAAPPPPGGDAGAIDIHTMQDFQAVLSLSTQCPVVVDCWATWCGPCKQLDPLLKEVVGSTGGAVKLAKLDIDNQALAPLVQQMQVSSVPTMFLIFGGRMLDVKVGVPPKQELRSWIAEAVALAEQQLGQQLGGGGRQQGGQDPKQQLEAGFAALDAPGGRAADIAPLFAGVLQEEAGAEAADKARALAGLAMCALIDDPPSLETARSLVANAKEASPSEVPAEVARAEALIELANDTEAALADPRSTDQLQAAVEADKRDHEARYALALRQFAAGQHQAAVDSALVLVRQDRDWREQAGKKLLLRFFDALGADSEIAKSGRRRLASVWFM